jgi:ABC-type glycerol-3-phosphate transport system substrate-binding protein
LVGFNWGAKLYDYNTKKAVWNSPEAVASLEFLVDVVKNGHPQISSLSATEATSSFAGGNAAMVWKERAGARGENPKTSVVKDKITRRHMPRTITTPYREPGWR